MPQLLTLLDHPSFSIWLRAVFLSSKRFYALAGASLPGTKVLGSLSPGTRAKDPAVCSSCHPIPWQCAFPSFHYWDKKVGRQLASFGSFRLLSEEEGRMRKPRGRLV